MRRRPRVGVLGGTFDGLHRGHRALLDRAFEVADRVGIGVTTDRYLAAHPKRLSRSIRPYALRRRIVQAYLGRRFPRRRYWLVPLDDPFGGSVAPGVDVLVASEETRRGAARVNQERRRRGLPPVRVELVPLELGEDLLPVSSSRIRAGLIDADGRRQRPIAVGFLGLPPGLAATAFQALRTRLPTSTPTLLRRVRPGRSPGPSAPRELARLRAVEAARGRDYGLGSAGAEASTLWVALADEHGPIGSPIQVAHGKVGALSGGISLRLGPRRRRWDRQAPNGHGAAGGAARKRKVK